MGGEDERQHERPKCQAAVIPKGSNASDSGTCLKEVS